MASDAGTLAQPFDFAREEIYGKPRGLWTQAFFRLIRNRLALVSGIVLLVISTTALLADVTEVVSRHSPIEQQYDYVNGSPTSEWWMGTDNLGRDNWARLLQGTLFSLKIGIGTQVVILFIGITVGMGAALGGRLSDTALMWVTDLAYAFPDLLAIILFRQILFDRDWPIIGSGDPQIPGVSGVLLSTILAISFVGWVTVARLIRGQMLSIKEQDYVTAARALGASPWRIVRVHMLPNTLSTVIVAVTFGIPLAIFAEAALSFIGLGVPPPDASLGSLISNGYAFLRSNEMMIVWPAIMVGLLMLCFTFLGDGLRDALDPRTRR
ncbi:MAG: ABC transporter permease [Tepidiformaceae bacterium]